VKLDRIKNLAPKNNDDYVTNNINTKQNNSNDIRKEN
jgi:hypothetical protein